MTTRDLCFHPFDSVYSDVSRRIREYKNELISNHQASDREIEWLDAIIGNFQNEADKWHIDDSLRQYRQELQRLRLSVLCLAGGAYLHICYDLPRVLADCWPGMSPYDVPEEIAGQRIYRKIGNYFPEAINDISRFREAVGIFGPAYRWTFTRREMEKWITLLRSEAWLNAKEMRLAESHERLYLEKKILELITETISKVGSRAVWNLPTLTPPKLYDAGSVLAAILLSLQSIKIWPELLTLLIGSIGGVISTTAFLQTRRVKDFKNIAEKMAFDRNNSLGTTDHSDLSEQEYLIDTLVAAEIHNMGIMIQGGLKEIFGRDKDRGDL